MSRVRFRQSIDRGFWRSKARHRQKQQQEHRQLSDDSLRQSESEHTPLAHLALSLNLADGENAAHLLVLLDDTLAVEQAEAMSAGIGSVEDMGELLLVHSLARISH